MSRNRSAVMVAREWVMRAELAQVQCRGWKEFGERVGMSGAHVGIVARGTPVTRKTAERIARGFGKKVEDLFDVQTPPPVEGRVRAPTQPALPFDTSPGAPVSAESAERVA